MDNLQNLDGMDIIPLILNTAANANANSTPVSTRYVIYLPSCYATLFLDASGYMVNEILTVLPLLIKQNNDMAHCQALIHWLCVASQGTATQGQVVIGPPFNAIPFILPTADKDLLNHRHLSLKLALLGLGQPTIGLEAALLQMASAVTVPMNDQQLAHDTKAAKAATPTLPSDKFQNTREPRILPLPLL
jgi:hypothetical protein